MTLKPGIQLRALLPLVCALGLTACSEESVTVQEVPKGSERIATVPTPHVHQAAPVDDLRIWTLPEGWREVENNAPMRLATIMAPGPNGDVEVAVTSFPGDVGGDLANVNRWRGQIALPPVDTAGLEALLERFSEPGHGGYITHLTGESSHLLAAAIHSDAADRTWFVRVMGDEATVIHLKPEVLAFAKTLTVAGNTP